MVSADNTCESSTTKKLSCADFYPFLFGNQLYVVTQKSEWQMFKKFCFPAVILIGVILFSACSDDNPTEPTDPTISTPNPTLSSIQADPTISTPNPTLSSIQANVFTPGCAFANCHGNSGTQANLNLTNGQSFADLVGVESQLFAPSKRVEAGDGGNSILIKILKGEVSPQMPQGRTPLSNAIIDSIEKWIDNGALNN
jgi:hypothetical protein